MLIDNEAFHVAAGFVTPASFYRWAHQRIFHAETKLADSAEPIDLVSLREQLQRGALEDVGGASYLSSLVDGVPRATNIDYYARVVSEKAQLRRVIQGLTQILDRCYEAEIPVDELIDDAQRVVKEVGASAVRDEFVVAEDWMGEVYTAIEHACQAKRIVTGVPTGLRTVDWLTRGLQPGDLIYVGARPSAGKTSLALQMALHASEHVMTGFVSLEMSRQMLGQRAVALAVLARVKGVRNGHKRFHAAKRACAMWASMA